jgi:hypothetical protein
MSIATKASETRDARERRIGENGAGSSTVFGPTEIDALRASIADGIAAGDPEECGRLILQMNGRDAIYESRRQVDLCLRQFQGNEPLLRIKRLIDPPGVTHAATAKRIDRRADFAWLKDHAAEYPGEWLILSRGKLWAHSLDLDIAQKEAEAAGLKERPLLYHV